jgi:hypothetical protein
MRPASLVSGRSTSALLLLTALLASGCAAHLGPRTVPVDHFSYNQAITRSWDEQLLLNLVRLRYRDTPLFLEVGAVVSSFELNGSLAASGGWSWPGSGSSAGVAVGGSYTETPTVSYTPLQGETFATRLLSPVAPVTLMLLSQSGWSIERLLLCCVQEMNGVRNAMAAAGPTPDYVPEYATFHRLAHLFRQLQIAGRLEAWAEPDGVIRLRMLRPDNEADTAAFDEVRRILALDPALDTFRITETRRPEAHDEIGILGRSMMAALFFLSQAVEVPGEDEAAGKVTVTQDADGTRFDWSKVTGRLLHVHSSPDEPQNAAVRIRHRDSWFYIADDDLNSKSTFNLVTFLFNLTAAGKGGVAPLLTYSLP